MLIHETIIKSSDIQKRILAVADLQFDQNFALGKLEVMLSYFRQIIDRESIDYVFILGDVINSLNVLQLPETYHRLLDFLSQLATHAPIVMVLGNHDTYFYNAQHQLQVAPAPLFPQYLQDLQQIPNLHLLHTSHLDSAHIFDDGAIRVLGLDLPGPCYLEDNPERNFHCDGQTTFNNLIQQYLPELTQVPDRNYYLLIHSPAYLKADLIPTNVMVLAGHNHHGLVPPVLDELTKFSDRGLVGPGLTRNRQHNTKYELFPRYARLRPTKKRPWLTLRPITYFSDRLLKPLNFFYPQISYAMIHESHAKTTFAVKENYHFISKKNVL